MSDQLMFKIVASFVQLELANWCKCNTFCILI